MNPTHTQYAATEVLDFPGVLTVKVLLTGDQSDGELAIFEDIVQPGVGAPRHIHHEQNETFFFLEGKFDVEIGGKRFHMSPGDVAFIPKGTIHAFKNVGETVGVLRYIFSPALKIEEMFRNFHQAQLDGSMSPEKMAEIALAHGQEMVGPPID